MPIKVVYIIKRSRVGKAGEYPSLDAMLKALREILENREKSGFLGKVWLTVEACEKEVINEATQH